MKRTILTLFAALALGACGKEASEQPHEQGTDAKATEGVPGQNGERKILYYRDPMGGPATSPVPKKDSMGMDYIPVYENEPAAANEVGVSISPEIIQAIGVQTEPAAITAFGQAVRAFGAVAENTRLQTIVSSRVEGWIKGLAVNAVGDAVKEGDPLFRLQSPELVAAEQDFLVALRSGAASRIAASSQRLRSLGLQEQTIADLKAGVAADRMVPFYAAHDGVVAALNVRDGAYVKPGDEIAILQNYSQVWVIASIAERDLPLIKKGAKASAQFPNSPGAERKGVVDFVYPTVDAVTRTGKARIVLDNSDGVLRPGAYADVVVAVDLKKRLAVPSEAILRDSSGEHVVVAMGGGRFMPMTVKTGIVADGMTEIIDGLKAGDDVVVSGQFLIDSESSLREAFRKMAPPHAHGASSDEARPKSAGDEGTP